MRRLLCLLALLAASGCGDDPKTTALFAIPGGPPGDDFYATPFPNDLWREADGTIDLSQFPTNSLIVEDYRAAADTLDGFGKNSAIYARFDGPLDGTSLPDPAASLLDDAAVFLVDVDPVSPGLGTRTPILAVSRRRHERSARTTRGGRSGFPLADHHYPLVTDRVRDAAGNAASPGVRRCLQRRRSAERRRARSEPLIASRRHGIPSARSSPRRCSPPSTAIVRVRRACSRRRRGRAGITPGPSTSRGSRQLHNEPPAG
jgi:hypothetical protein